jgi:hypothetical protein
VRLPDSAQKTIDVELDHLYSDANSDLHPQSRIYLYRALGPSSPEKDSRQKSPHKPTIADRVRTRIAFLTAQKVIPLWEAACRETDTNFPDQPGERNEEKKREDAYANLRAHNRIEAISVYDVPRVYCPAHIMEMAEMAFRGGDIENYDAFRDEANEWWQIYGRPEGMERECFIKEAAQEALYEALGWTDYSEDFPYLVNMENERELAMHHHHAPGGSALLAYAGIFNEKRFRFDWEKRREFWQWWLEEAIPHACKSER